MASPDESLISCNNTRSYLFIICKEMTFYCKISFLILISLLIIYTFHALYKVPVDYKVIDAHEECFIKLLILDGISLKIPDAWEMFG